MYFKLSAECLKYFGGFPFLKYITQDSHFELLFVPQIGFTQFIQCSSSFHMQDRGCSHIISVAKEEGGGDSWGFSKLLLIGRIIFSDKGGGTVWPI